MANPLRSDPTRCTLIRRAFMGDMRKRFRGLRVAIVDLVERENAFGLGDGRHRPGKVNDVPHVRTIPVDAILNTDPAAVAAAAALLANARWVFETDAGKLNAYRGWLTQQVEAGILEVDPLNAGQPWAQPYIRSAYKKGMLRAYMDTKRLGGPGWDFAEGGQGAFMKMAFDGPVAQQKLAILGTRTYTDLKNITGQMDADMSRILTQGMAEGRGPRELARMLAKDVEGLEKRRALVVARTETTFAHSEGQLDAFEAMNIQEVGVMAEWSTATDGEVCELCQPLEGIILTIAEARGMIPRHPNCRCAWIPGSVGEHKGGTTKSVWAGPEQGIMPPGTLPTGKTTGQVWSKDEVGSRIRDSFKAEHPKLGAKAARAASRWGGADKKISGKLKPGSKKWYAFKEAEAQQKAAALEVAKAEAAQTAQAAKYIHSQKVKVGLLKKKHGLTEPKDEWFVVPPDEEAAQLTPTGLDAYLERKGITTATPEDKAVVLKAKPDHPATPNLAAQFDEADALVVRLRAVQEEAKLQAKKALHAVKVKVGLTKKKYGLKKTWLFYPGDSPVPTLTSEGAEAYAKRRGLAEWTATDWPAVLDDWKALLKADPNKPVLTAQMEALEAHVQKRIAGRKAAEKAAEDAGAAVKAWKAQTAPSSDVVDLANYDTLPGWGKPKKGKTQSYGTIIFDSEGRVLMREPKGHYGGAHWTFAKGGGYKPGSTALAELAEETGHKGAIHGVVPGAFEGTTTKTNYFVGVSQGFDAGLMDLETEATKWMTFKEAVEAIAKSNNPKVVGRDTNVLLAAYAALGDPDAQAAWVALKKSGNEAFAKSKEAAAKAAHAHKVKLGMAKSHYAKKKFGGGVVDEDWVNPATKQKLNPEGVNKVLAEKGWHTTTLPPDTLQQILAADDVVQQKVVMDGLKKAPKSTPAPRPVSGELLIDPGKLKEFFEEGYNYPESAVDDLVAQVALKTTLKEQLDALDYLIHFTDAELDRITVAVKAPAPAGLALDAREVRKLLLKEWPEDAVDDVVTQVLAKPTLDEQMAALGKLTGSTPEELAKLAVVERLPPAVAVKEIDTVKLKTFLLKYDDDEQTVDWIVTQIAAHDSYDEAILYLKREVDITPDGLIVEYTKKAIDSFTKTTHVAAPAEPGLNPFVLKAVFKKAYKGKAPSDGALDVVVQEVLSKKGVKAQLKELDNLTPGYTIQTGVKKKLQTRMTFEQAAKLAGAPPAPAGTGKAIDGVALKNMLVDEYGYRPHKVDEVIAAMFEEATYAKQLEYISIVSNLTPDELKKITTTKGVADLASKVAAKKTPPLGSHAFWDEADLFSPTGGRTKKIYPSAAEDKFVKLGYDEDQVEALKGIVWENPSLETQLPELADYAAKNPPKGTPGATGAARAATGAKAGAKARVAADVPLIGDNDFWMGTKYGGSEHPNWFDIPATKKRLRELGFSATQVDAMADIIEGSEHYLDALEGIGSFAKAHPPKGTPKAVAAAPTARPKIPPLGDSDFWGPRYIDEDGWIDLYKAKKRFKTLGFDEHAIEDLVDIIAEADSFDEQLSLMGLYAKAHPPKAPVGVAAALADEEMVLDYDALKAFLEEAFGGKKAAAGALEVFVDEVLSKKGVREQLRELGLIVSAGKVTAAEKKKLVVPMAAMKPKPAKLAHTTLAPYLAQKEGKSLAWAQAAAKEIQGAGGYEKQVVKLLQKLSGPIDHNLVNRWIEDAVVVHWTKKAGGAAKKAWRMPKEPVLDADAARAWLKEIWPHERADTIEGLLQEALMQKDAAAQLHHLKLFAPTPKDATGLAEKVMAARYTMTKKPIGVKGTALTDFLIEHGPYKSKTWATKAAMKVTAIKEYPKQIIAVIDAAGGMSDEATQAFMNKVVVYQYTRKPRVVVPGAADTVAGLTGKNAKKARVLMGAKAPKVPVGLDPAKTKAFFTDVVGEYADPENIDDSLSMIFSKPTFKQQYDELVIQLDFDPEDLADPQIQAELKALFAYKKTTRAAAKKAAAPGAGPAATDAPEMLAFAAPGKSFNPKAVQLFIEDIAKKHGASQNMVEEALNIVFTETDFGDQFQSLLGVVGYNMADLSNPQVHAQLSDLVVYGKGVTKKVPKPTVAGQLDAAEVEKHLSKMFGDDAHVFVDEVLQKEGMEAQLKHLEHLVPHEKISPLAKKFLTGGADLPPAAPAVTKFPVPLERDLKKIKDLPGSTRPYLAVDKAGKKWVVKDASGSGIAPGHLRSEGLADDLYKIMGFDTPNGAVVDAPGGPRKVTEFLEGGQTLAEWKVRKHAKTVRDMYAQIKKGYVADCLLANHDVAGLSFDNIFIVGGKAYRIDNGGALTYRAQGAAKRTWGPKVKELATMKDASHNAQTAAIFGDITEEEIQEQIMAIVAKRSEILQHIPDDGLRATMAARLDDLAAKLPATKATRPRKAAPRGARRAAYAPDEEAVRRAKAARSNGITLASDKDKIEDCNVLMWEEVGADGGATTRVQFKVTKKGSDALIDALGDELVKARAIRPVASQRASNVHPDDHYWDTVLKGLKTVNHHAQDGEYNTGTLAELAKIKEEIAGALPGAKGAKKKMLLHYQEALAEIEEAKAKQGVTGKLAQYVHKPPKKAAAPAPARRKYTVHRDAGIDYRLMNYTKGKTAAKPSAGRNMFSTAESYTIDIEGGAKMKFIPNDGSFSDASGRALHGTVTMMLPEEMTEEAIRRAMGVLDELGVNAAPPSAAFEEALYLHRGVYINKKHTLAGYKAIWENTTISDEEKVVQLKAWIKKSMKIDVDKVKHYDPAGYARHADGAGFRHWERWDLGAEEVAKKMDGYAVFHSTGSLGSSPRGYVQKTLAAILDSDGEFTSTTGRIRKGVSVSSTGGASSSSDMSSGGASYFFCRIKKDTASSKGFYFRVGTLSRQDAISYRGDNFGRISNIRNRASTVGEYKQVAGNSGNETIFKEGLSIDDIDFIRVHDDAERLDVIKVFKNRGIHALPDGRAVEDVVVAGQKKARARRKGL